MSNIEVRTKEKSSDVLISLVFPSKFEIRHSIFVILFSFLLLCATFVSPALAAKFNLVAPQPAAQVGEQAVVYVELLPLPGEKVMGGRITLTVNPQYAMLSPDRTSYGSDPVFSRVEKFTADPISGSITYNVQTDEPISEPKIFLQIPMKFVKAGISSISFTSYVYFSDLKPVPANSGYQRVAGVTGPVDPILYTTLAGENSTLKLSSLTKQLEFTQTGGEGANEAAMAMMDAQLGAALQETKSDEEAAVVIEFSKRKKRIGLKQWIELDVMVTKFPQYDSLGVVVVKVKYDPGALMYTDRNGQEKNSVDLNNVFNVAFDNKVDRLKGEIKLSLGLNLGISDNALTKPPVKIATLYFKSLTETASTLVTMESVRVPVANKESKMAIHAADISVSSAEGACDSDLPATLCSGTFKVTGTVKFSLANTDTQVNTYNAGGTQTLGPRLNKFFLTQNWDMHMDGSFRNGLRLHGGLAHSPGTPQTVSIDMMSNNWTATFGNFNAAYSGSQLVSFTSSALTGLQLNYDFGGFKVRALNAEIKSSPQQKTFNGLGNNGPYDLPGINTAIQASIRIKKNGTQMTPDEYTLDIEHSKISFTRDIQTTDTIVAEYQQVAQQMLFSMGNIQAYRADYSKNENFKAGATFLTKVASKNTTAVKLGALDKVDTLGGSTPGVTFTVAPCKFFGLSTLNPNPNGTPYPDCVEVQLSHQYIVKGSLVITNTSANTPGTFTENSPAIYIDHRGYLEGRFTFNKEKLTLVGQQISYYFYNPALMSRPNYVVFMIGPGDRTSTYEQMRNWPSDMFPGSEILYLSKEDRSDRKPEDGIMCFKKGDIVDDATICPNVETNNSLKTYYLEGQNSYDTYLRFNEGAIASPLDYIIMKYMPVPPDSTGGSQFQKTAWNLDTSMKIGTKLNIVAEYGMANSDKASSFNSINEIVTVDVPTSGPQEGSTCKFVQAVDSPTGQDTLRCRLNQQKLLGATTIQLQRCDRPVATSRDCADPPTYNDAIQYQVFVQPSDIDLANGFIYFYANEANTRFNPGIPRDPAGFPINKGDKFIVNYTYDQALSRVVNGSAYYVTARYINKIVSATVEKRAIEPNFDRSLSAFGATEVSHNKYDLSVQAAKNLSLKYSDTKSLNETVNDKGIVTDASSNPIQSFGLNYSSKWLRSLLLTKDITGLKGFSTGSSTTTVTDNVTKLISGAMSISLKKDMYTLNLAHSDNVNDVRAGTFSDTKSRRNDYVFKYKPSQLYGFGMELGNTIDSPTGAVTNKRNFTIDVTPFLQLATINIAFSRDNNRPSEFATPSTTLGINYGVSFPKVRKLNGLKFNFTRTQNPGDSLTGLNSSRNDTLTSGFQTYLTKNLTITPLYTRTSNMAGVSSHILSNNMNWAVAWNKKIGESGNLTTSFSQVKSNSQTTTLTAAAPITSINASNNKTINLGFIPSTNTHVTTNFVNTYSGGLVSAKNMTVDYSRNLTREILFSTELKIVRTFGFSTSKNITRSLSFKWQLNPNSSLNLNYSRYFTYIGAKPPPPITTFSTELSTTFY